MGSEPVYDVAIIGGGIAGLQAALTLGRARRSVLLMDAGEPRHRFAGQMHNLLGADGVTPAQFYAAAHAELARYAHITFQRAILMAAQPVEGGFTLTDAQGATHQARKLLFACGVVDRLPPIAGITEAWGTQVLHCAYCHGYEQAGKTIAALTSADGAWAMLESLWSLHATTLHFYFEQGSTPDEALQEKLRARGVAVELQPITQVQRTGDSLRLTLADASQRDCDVLFVKPINSPPSLVPFELGCQPVNYATIAVNDWCQTHATGVYAAGDIAGGLQQLATAQNSGLRAAVMINTELTRDALA